MTQAPLDKLAHELALETSESAIECLAINVSENEVDWWELDASSASLCSDCLLYLELRGLLVRHPRNHAWYRIDRGLL